MKNGKVISVLMISVIFGLSACSSPQVKETQEPPVSGKETREQSVAKPMAEAVPMPVQKSVTPPPNPLTDPASMLSKRRVLFDYDKYDVKQEYQDLVKAHADYLVANRHAIIILEGNADERGSREYNLALGQKRAAAVKKLMNVHGVSDRQIETISFGEEWPVAHGSNETAWQQNRRVDMRYAGE